MSEEQDQHNQQNNNTFKPALLTRIEIDWLSGKVQVSKAYEYWLRFNIKKKIKALSAFELPLILKNGFILKNNENARIGSASDSNQGTTPSFLPDSRLINGSLDMAASHWWRH